MIFEDIVGNTIRIPDERLCGMNRDDRYYLWCSGDDEYRVTSDTFYACMDALGEKRC